MAKKPAPLPKFKPGSPAQLRKAAVTANQPVSLPEEVGNASPTGQKLRTRKTGLSRI